MPAPALPIDPFAPEDAPARWRVSRDRALALFALALLCFFAPLGLAAGGVAWLTAGFDLRHASLGSEQRRHVHHARLLAIGVVVVAAVCVAFQGAAGVVSVSGAG